MAREPGIHNHHGEYGFRVRACARPGMTETRYPRFCANPPTEIIGE